MVVERTRALVLACNKWDLMDDERRRYLERNGEGPGEHPGRRGSTSQRNRQRGGSWCRTQHALNSWQRRVSTGRLNTFLRELADAHNPIRGGNSPFFRHLGGNLPSHISSSSGGFLEAGYRRFIERRLCGGIRLRGTPIEIQLRIGKKRNRYVDFPKALGQPGRACGESTCSVWCTKRIPAAVAGWSCRGIASGQSIAGDRGFSPSG